MYFINWRRWSDSRFFSRTRSVSYPSANRGPQIHIHRYGISMVVESFSCIDDQQLSVISWAFFLLNLLSLKNVSNFKARYIWSKTGSGKKTQNPFPYKLSCSTYVCDGRYFFSIELDLRRQEERRRGSSLAKTSTLSRFYWLSKTNKHLSPPLIPASQQQQQQQQQQHPHISLSRCESKG